MAMVMHMAKNESQIEPNEFPATIPVDAIVRQDKPAKIKIPAITHSIHLIPISPLEAMENSW